MTGAPQAHTHAGAVVFRQGSTGREYLVVRSSDRTSWVLPKGHIERGETLEQTALRELMEEAGVRAEIVAPLGNVFVPKQNALIAYFLARHLGEVESPERREKRWLSARDATATLSFADAREMLQRAEKNAG